jgi:asparagine synthase (glutamine-hydrolysing)
MCGVAGIYNFKSNAPVERNIISRMTRILAHRGPDDEGLYFDHALALGHRRLSILDRSQRGHQPMSTAERRFVITYNGEVYNYVELRKQLETAGHVFRTDTDTEVILTLYADMGADCLQLLNGMFALAIWDSVEQKLFLARDRIGIKPLYFAETADGVIFASEIKALLVSGLISTDVALPYIDTYLSFGYVPGAETLFKGIRRVLPGHWLQIQSQDIVSTCYWDLAFAPNHHRSARATAEELKQLLLDSVRIHLRSDVPVGIFLSGGLDSSATVALAAEAGAENLNTFSVAHEEGGQYDETPFAQLVADRFRTNHHVLRMNSNQFLDCIPRFVWHMDEPVAEAPALAFYLISRLLREHVTVALSGEGSDELFGGYEVYRYMLWLEQYRKLPSSIRSLVQATGNRMPWQKIRKYSRLAQHSLEDRYRGVPNYETAFRSSLYSDDFAAAACNSPGDPLRQHYSKSAKHDALTRLLYTDLKTWLVDDLLIKADRMTMAHSVELRVPFLDYRVVEYAATIPSNMKLRHGIGKWILKRAMTNRLPSEILSRRKMGFPTPLAQMFQRDLSGYLRDLLLSPTALSRNYFNRAAVEKLIDDNHQKIRDHHRLLWQLVVLEEWHRQFIDQEPVRYAIA